MVERLNACLWLMVRSVGTASRYAPLYVHSFRLVAPKKLTEAERFHLRYHRYEDIETVADRLRWCRHHLGLTQREVEALTGLGHSLYMNLENGDCDRFPADVADRLAGLYRIPVTDLLDGYNLFLYRGQGCQLKQLRARYGMNRKQFAALVGVIPETYGPWKREAVRIGKRAWERYFGRFFEGESL